MLLLDRPLKALKRSLSRKYPKNKTSIVVASPHKVGSTWLGNVLSDLYGLERFPVPNNRLLGRLAVDVPLDELIPEFSRAKAPFLHKTHAYPPGVSVGEAGVPIMLLTMVRDPRDILVSAAHYLAQLPPEKGVGTTISAPRTSADGFRACCERGISSSTDWRHGAATPTPR